jgi:hypothetical protein
MATSGAQSYAEVDVTAWPLERSESLGTKPKRWLRDPETQQRRLLSHPDRMVAT